MFTSSVSIMLSCFRCIIFASCSIVFSRVSPASIATWAWWSSLPQRSRRACGGSTPTQTHQTQSPACSPAHLQTDKQVSTTEKGAIHPLWLVELWGAISENDFKEFLNSTSEYFTHLPAAFMVTLLGLVAPTITIRSIHDWVVKWASWARLLSPNTYIHYVTLQTPSF